MKARLQTLILIGLAGFFGLSIVRWAWSDDKATSMQERSRDVIDDMSPTPPPQGAIVLFNGKDTSPWQGGGGKPCPWKVLDDGTLEVVLKTGDISTKQKFLDFQLHVEFWLPNLPPDVKSQARANSGVYLQGLYEIQVLDSYNNPTYAKGGCGAIYGKKDPDNFDTAVRPPEKWNKYDATFRAARFDATGKKTENARVTVLWNGVKVHDNYEIPGPTAGGKESAEPGPIRLQDHHNLVRYRSIWIVPIEGEKK